MKNELLITELKYEEWIECEKCEGTGHDIFMEGDGILCPKCKGIGEKNEE